jgi:hypothetical protein
MSAFSLSPDLDVRPTAYGGRGVFATRALPAGTPLLAVPAPLAHVVYRAFRKEACAECFGYDAGRHWPLAACAGAAVFCAPPCRAAWEARAGAVGVEAWTSAGAWLQKTALSPDEDDEDGAPPGEDEIARVWRAAQAGADALDGQLGAKAQNKAVRALRAHPDTLGLLLNGFITLHTQPGALAELAALVPTAKPYPTPGALRAHAESFLALRRLVPAAMRAVVTPANAREIACRDACNSFGVWSQPEDDTAEMLGFGTLSLLQIEIGLIGDRAGIWAASSYFNHSCVPSVTKARIGRAWHFVLGRAVEPGEELCISYLGQDDLVEWTYAHRQERLRGAWGFDCACAQCKMQGTGAIASTA